MLVSRCSSWPESRRLATYHPIRFRSELCAMATSFDDAHRPIIAVAVVLGAGCLGDLVAAVKRVRASRQPASSFESLQEPSNIAEPTFAIGEPAGLKADALRCDERLGMTSPTERTTRGCRVYSADVAANR